MAAKKRAEPKPAEVPVPAQTTGRKPWKKKTPVDIFLDQEEKVRREVEQAEQELEQKRDQLRKFQEARRIFETS
jgi:hypothetical protein